MNHIHIGTANLEKSREFYEKFFGFRKQFDHGEGVFLVDSKGFLLAIDPVSTVPAMPDWFHLGFCQKDCESVKAVYDKMLDSGVKFAKPYQEYGNEAAAFYAIDPDGYKVEVSWHKD